MLYYWYEMSHAAVQPWRTGANMGRYWLSNPANPIADTPAARAMQASLEMFERMTRRYGKPEFGIKSIEVEGKEYPVEEVTIWEKPFCRLLHFNRRFGSARVAPEQREKVLIVAPMSGHYATLLRGTVRDMLPNFDVYITDWTDARVVPLVKGDFDLDDYVDYVIEMLELLGPGTHVMGVCQPSVPVLAAVSVMSKQKHRALPASMVLMGGPIDTRRNPTVVNKLAQEKGTDWFAKNVIVKVPMPNPGFMRSVYPGFLQLTGFMTMNLDRHIDAHHDLFLHLVTGDGESADKHTEFYDEYMAVMDLTAEFYLQTVEQVFVRHALPEGTYEHRGELINPSLITKVALMTVEGEKDDISGVGQTEAAHDICDKIPAKKRAHYLQPGVGHYGVFNGRRFRSEIAPRIVKFMRANRHKS